MGILTVASVLFVIVGLAGCVFSAYATQYALGFMSLVLLFAGFWGIGFASDDDGKKTAAPTAITQACDSHGGVNPNARQIVVHRGIHNTSTKAYTCNEGKTLHVVGK